MGKIDWDVVTNFTDAVTTTLKTVTFPKVQEQVYLRNQGNANFTYTIGSQSGTLTPGQSVTVNQDVSSFTLQAVSGTHTFELRAKEKGTEINETDNNLPSNIAEQLNTLSSSVAEKATKEELNVARTEKIQASRLETSVDTNKIKLVNLSDEVKQTITGTTPITVSPTVTPVVLDDNNVSVAIIPTFGNLELLNDPYLTKTYVAENGGKIQGIISKGLPFTVNGVVFTRGVSGATLGWANVPLPTGIVSGDEVTIFALLKSDLANQSNMFVRFKDVANAFLATSLNSRKTKSTEWEWVTVNTTVPTNAVTVSIGISHAVATNGFLVLPHIFKGKASLPSIPRVVKKEQLDVPLYNEVVNENNFKKVMEHIMNPFQKTRIKLLGDSITAGVGGTGYSATGDLIGTTGFKENLTTATCWANMLKDNLESNFNKDLTIEPNHPSIGNNYPYTMAYSTALLMSFAINLNSGIVDNGINFNIYGDHFSVYYAKTAGSGILNVKVDGISVATIDAYNSTNTYGNKYDVTGLSLGAHKVEILETNTKNPSASGTSAYLEGFIIPKSLVVKNFGCSGIDSKYIWLNQTSFFEDSDDIYIIQIGTNDRQSRDTIAAYKSHVREIVKYLQSKGKLVVLMAASPVSLTSDNNAVQRFRMDDVNTAVSQMTKDYNIGFISNYDAFFRYEKETGTSIDQLLAADGLHPNDTGYKVMYENITRHLGFSLIRQGIAYN